MQEKGEASEVPIVEAGAGPINIPLQLAFLVAMPRPRQETTTTSRHASNDDEEEEIPEVMLGTTAVSVPVPHQGSASAGRRINKKNESPALDLKGIFGSTGGESAMTSSA